MMVSVGVRKLVIPGLFAIVGAGLILVVWSHRLNFGDIDCMGSGYGGGTDIAVTITPRLLNPHDPQQVRVGALEYISGYHLSSDDPRFGGWSGLSVARDRLTAVSDAGFWLTAQFGSGHAADQPFENFRLGSLSGRCEDTDKEDFDAEDIIALPYGHLVSFEQNTHRLEVMTEPGGWSYGVSMLDAVMAGLSPNSGVEAMTFDSKDRLLLFAEHGRDTQGRLPVWRISDSDHAETIFISLPRNYAPTAAALLPSGDILLLTRTFSVVGGFRVKLMLWPILNQETGNTQTLIDLATLEAPLLVDNFEGLAIIPEFTVSTEAPGYVRIALLSDDNYSGQQETLFLIFDLLM